MKKTNFKVFVLTGLFVTTNVSAGVYATIGGSYHDFTSATVKNEIIDPGAAFSFEAGLRKYLGAGFTIEAGANLSTSATRVKSDLMCDTTTGDYVECEIEKQTNLLLFPLRFRYKLNLGSVGLSVGVGGSAYVLNRSLKVVSENALYALYVDGNSEKEKIGVSPSVKAAISFQTLELSYTFDFGIGDENVGFGSNHKIHVGYSGGF